MDLGVTVDTDLKFHTHIRTVSHKAGGLAHSFLKSTVCRAKEFMLFLLTSHIRPIIEYCSCVWYSGYAADMRLLECIQRRWTKQIEGIGMLSYGERLQTLDLYSVQGRQLRADMIQCWKMFNGKSCLSPDDIFGVQPAQNRTRGHCHKIFVQRPNTDVRKRSFSMRCVRLWNALPEDVVCANDLSTFKRLLARSLGDKLFEFV